jgi:hypothetical protein
MLTEIISLCIASYFVNGCNIDKNKNTLLKQDQEENENKKINNCGLLIEENNKLKEELIKTKYKFIDFNAIEFDRSAISGKQISIEEWTKIIPYMPNLKGLNLAEKLNNIEITEDFVKALPENLEYLDLHTNYISDTSFINIIKGFNKMENLESIDLSLSNITDESIKEFVKYSDNIQNLTFLNFNSVGKITQESIKMISEILPNFESLETISLDSPDGYYIDEDTLEDFLKIMDTLSNAINDMRKLENVYFGFNFQSKKNKNKSEYIQLYNSNIKKNKKTIKLRQEINNELKKSGFL